MSLSIKNDSGRPSGGYAILEGPGLQGLTLLAIENCYSGMFLGEDGRWGKSPFLFPVEPAPGAPDALLLGPHIVDFVPTELQIGLRTQAGVELGRLFWVDIIPSRNPGAITSTAVFADLAQRAAEKVALDAKQKKAEEDAAARDLAAQTQAEQKLTEQKQAEQKQAEDDAKTKQLATIDPDPGLDEKKKSWRGFAILAAALMIAGGALAAYLVLRQKPIEPASTTPCATRFAARLQGLDALPDTGKVALGADALAAGCGAEAFRAFDSADQRTSEEAAWQLGRFYDPNETDPVYRNNAAVHADWATDYYRPWRDRSPRQAAALKTLCATAGQAVSSRPSCAP